MICPKLFVYCAAAILAAPFTQAADNVALIIANENYSDMRDVVGASAGLGAEPALRQAGFEVITLADIDRDGLLHAAGDLEAALTGADRVLVFLNGQFASTQRDSWLLTTDADRQGALSVGMYGLSVNGLMDLMAEKDGAAVMMIGAEQGEEAPGPGLFYGYVAGAIPQGVTVYSGPTNDLLDLLRNDLLVPGTTTRQVVATAAGSVSAQGFLSSTVAFLPVTPAGTDNSAPGSEFQDWARARSAGTVTAVKTFLRRYPGGTYADQANTLLNELQKTPLVLAEDAETALDLSREARRDIQRDLALLGYDPRGIDGIFGHATRAAVKNWQAERRFPATGFVTGNQVSALNAAASVRGRELAEESRRRREELARQDAAYWRTTGRNGNEDGLRAYLLRYPDGKNATEARKQLKAIEDIRLASAARAEREVWDRAISAGTIRAYLTYLEQYPRGRFASNARRKVADLEKADADAAAKAALIAEEKRIVSDQPLRLRVERRLKALGYNPGHVDGQFDSETRKALRQFQRASGFNPSGYVTRRTFVRLTS